MSNNFFLEFQNEYEDMYFTMLFTHLYNIRRNKRPLDKNEIIEQLKMKNSDHKIFVEHQNLFDTNDIKKILEHNPLFFGYVKNKTLDLCKCAINSFNKKGYVHIEDSKLLMQYIQEYDEELVEMIIKSPHTSLLKYHQLIPNKYLNKEKIHNIIIKYNEAINSFPEHIDQELCEKMISSSVDSIQYIPKKFHSEKIRESVIKSGKICNLYRYIDIDPSMYVNIFKQDPNIIKIIPEKYQTYKMCADSVIYNIDNLQYCYHITKKLLNYIFESKKGTERKKRFSFINYYSEESIIRILEVRPELLGILWKQTHNIILTAIMKDGNLIKYVDEPTPEYIKIAGIYRPKPHITILHNFHKKKKFACDVSFIY
ncbi:hypothetical protein Catovirus_1_31 [Catovirus CTV1]|uniref:DUF4116 domain-containing protein n=1 Tax=Catovirus CTV1 TaxID=1977631 RepID=A0A1V0S8F4_9VIRU|nr:hypothetical protein Catovirus_1_31 [Catovirus CTV1]